MNRITRNTLTGAHRFAGSRNRAGQNATLVGLISLIVAVTVGICMLAVPASARTVQSSTGSSVGTSVVPMIPRAPCSYSAQHKAKHKHLIVHRTHLYGQICKRVHKTRHATMWWDPSSWSAWYNRSNSIAGGLVYGCGIGGFKGVTYHLYVQNRVTGYYLHKRIRVFCEDDTVGFGRKVLTGSNICRMPWIDNGGRAPGGHRAYCHYRVTYHEHFWGEPDNSGTVGYGWIKP